MEVSIFPDEDLPVNALLAKGFVEARLHTDEPLEEFADRVWELQESLARSVANPIYVVVDPESEREIARHEGAALRGQQIEKFAEFLRGSTQVAMLDR